MTGNMIDLFNLKDRLLAIYDEPTERNEEKYGVKIIKYDPMKLLELNIDLISCIGDPRHKYDLINEVRLYPYSLVYTNLIHDSAIIVSKDMIKSGVYIQPYTILFSNVSVGNHVSICSSCSIGHGTKIGHFSTIGHKVFTGGGVEIGDGVLIGSGANILPGIKIGEGSKVGMGAAVTKNVKPNTVVAGVPALKKKRLEVWN